MEDVTVPDAVATEAPVSEECGSGGCETTTEAVATEAVTEPAAEEHTPPVDAVAPAEAELAGAT